MISVLSALAVTCCSGCYVGTHVRAAVNPAWGDVKSTGGVTFDGGGMKQWERTKYLTLGVFGEASLFPGTGRANGAGGGTSRFELRRFTDHGSGRRFAFWFAQLYVGYAVSSDAPYARGHAIVEGYFGHGWGRHDYEVNGSRAFTIGLTARRGSTHIAAAGSTHFVRRRARTAVVLAS